MNDEYPVEAEAACQQVNAMPPPPTLYGLPQFGMLGTDRDLTKAEIEQRNRECAAQQAIYVLEQARQIRANPALMADVRAHIRKLRDDGAALLDDIGG